ncbi:hypothetical protein TSAR_001323 [Trichomalopsis sarcophagae]|uniref:N-acetyltransferase domain-containing protein n=1 Tax=Trichomalopsis sarcophagae TaxID=543379 RepID=A0A232F0Y8_9HYME|nr:hypothetical protein TSAR_001323 [Trichomalopsis sarcophagae]
MKIKNLENIRPVPADWKRPAGPPHVWQQLEVDEQLNDGTTERVRIIIQDIPEDRYDEVVEYMSNFFLSELNIFVSLKIKEYKDAIEDYRKLIKHFLNENISIGAFKLGSDDSLRELVAVNVLFVETKEANKSLENIVTNFKSRSLKKYCNFKNNILENVDIYRTYGVDKYICSAGLRVSPAFRGQKLGVRLLEIRNDIGRKHEIAITSTVFTGVQAQKQAKRSGFETNLSLNYVEILDDDGRPMFPDIDLRSQGAVLKIMSKKLL